MDEKSGRRIYEEGWQISRKFVLMNRAGWTGTSLGAGEEASLTEVCADSEIFVLTLSLLGVGASLDEQCCRKPNWTP